jgi:hypothetical protein
MRAHGRLGDCLVSLARPVGPQVIPVGLATLWQRISRSFGDRRPNPCATVATGDIG